MDRGQALLGIVAPHPPIMVAAVGGPDAAVTAASIGAMRTAAAALDSFGPDAIVVVSPHARGYSNAITVDTSPRVTGTFARFGASDDGITSDTDVPLARSIIDALAAEEIGVVDRATDSRAYPGELDHGVLVPLSFLDPGGRIPLVVVSLSGMSLDSHRRAGACIAAASASLGRRIAFLASGDLSHRLTREAPAGYNPNAAEFDHTVVELFRSSRLDELRRIDPVLIDEAGECGLRSFIALSGALPEARSVVLAYEAPWGVGYLTALVGDESTLTAVGIDPGTQAPDTHGTDAHISTGDTPDTPTAGRKGGSAGNDSHPLVSLARATIEATIRAEPVPDPIIPDETPVPARAGAFVTLHREGALRGCIGTIAPTEPTLASEVAANAVKAATGDPRFQSLTLDELADLDVKVDVLHPPEPATEADLDPEVYGVIVTSGRRRGLLLPALDGVDTIAEQLAIACRKAGIHPSERFSIERFRVDRYS